MLVHSKGWAPIGAAGVSLGYVIAGTPELAALPPGFLPRPKWAVSGANSIIETRPANEGHLNVVNGNNPAYRKPMQAGPSLDGWGSDLNVCSV